jgi:ABC-type multidrug transport system ATPase subunit
VLTVEGLGKRFGPRWLFRNVGFKLDVGDRLVILGRNGSGKSTLLRTISGLSAPTEGKVHIPGDPRRTLSLASVEMSLYPSLTVAEHLEFAADLRGCPARVDELLETVGLADSRNLYSQRLSTGMKARLKLALAIQPEPSVLLLDEPGVSLDEAGRRLVEHVLEEQSSRGCAVIATNESSERRFATHELRLAD